MNDRFNDRLNDWPLSDKPDILESLVACRTPGLIGVRHHSAALARSLESLLERFSPTSLLVEMPSDFAPWLPYLADQDTVAPVALSAVEAAGSLAFYPLADFSPEYVAVRWALRRGISVVPCDLSVSARWNEADLEPPPQPLATGLQEQQDVLGRLLQRTESRDTGQLWERLVESPAMTTAAEAVRRAGLMFGWAVRASTSRVSLRDQVREAVMRQAIRQAPAGSVAVVGAFHAPVLLPEAREHYAEWDAHCLAALSETPETVGVSLVPYGFEQLDERSGYPAGIQDPVWHQRMMEAESLAALDRGAVELVVAICRALRNQGHVAGTPDAAEVVRMMRDLARLRRLPVAGRSELIEALGSCLAQGELTGRAREVAKAAEQVLIGRRQGRVTSRAPRCGLAVSIEQTLTELSLPCAATMSEKGQEGPREIRLDILRSARDRAKAVTLRRLSVLGIPYAERVDGVATGARENLAERWQVRWQQGTAATIAAVARFGVSLPQAAAGAVRFRFQQQALGSVLPAAECQPARWLERIELAAECGLSELLQADLAALPDSFIPTANLSELVRAMTLWGRIAAGHIAALPIAAADACPPWVYPFAPDAFAHLPALLLEAALQRLDGLAGSSEPQDITGTCDLAYWYHDGPELHPERFIGWCQRTLLGGGDGMRGTSAGVLALFERLDRQQLAALISGWFDRATHQAGRQQLRGHLLGLTQALFPFMVCDPSWLAGLEERLQGSRDSDFLPRLPALRGAFQQFSPADRRRLLRVRLESYADRGMDLPHDFWEAQLGVDAGSWQAMLREADLQGRAAIEQLLPSFPFSPENLGTQAKSRESTAGDPVAAPADQAGQRGGQQIPLADRWRMILGVPPESQGPACRAAQRLDELYGRGQGEGARAGIGNPEGASRRGGDQAPTPTLVEWYDELEQLFGSDVCQEVVGQAVEQGNLAAAGLLDPEQVSPSMDLLRQVLSLAGGLPEQRAEKLRKLARRITTAMAQQLAVRLQPALHGLASPRPTRRRGRKLHLQRTIRDNLVHAYRRRNGKPSVIAKHGVFQSVARREMDWHLTLVVDVSGSMTASVIYSAICAAIFAELPALTVRFLAFSTAVIDLSDKVIDPLSLLLEVQVGGGTRIGLGLAAARSMIQVPQRSLVVLVTDFEEGVSIGELLAEIRALAGSGVRCLGLAALDDTGVARFHQGIASMVAAAGMSVAAVAPEQLARWVGEQIRGQASGLTGSSTENLI